MNSAEINPEGPAPSVRALMEELLRKRITRACPVTAGYSATQRWLITTELGTRYFCKVGASDPSRDMLRQEAWVYDRLQLPCMPDVVAWRDDAVNPVLILEDLSHCRWPPPWTDRSVAMSLKVIEGIHAVSAPLLSYAERNGSDGAWWDAIRGQPEPFLRLEVVSPEWLRASLPTLLESEASVSPRGSTVVHCDLRSDNFCFSDSGARLVDWSLACLGNPKIDLGLFLPGLAVEHNLRPQDILPNEAGIASWVAGFFAWHASKAFIPEAPRVRAMQLRHLQAALPWAREQLGLEDLHVSYSGRQDSVDMRREP